MKKPRKGRKLTVRQVRRIREMYWAWESNYSTRDLARMYRVSQSTVWDVVNRKTWRKVD